AAVVGQQAAKRPLALEEARLHRVRDAAVVGHVAEHPAREAEEAGLDDQREQQRDPDQPLLDGNTLGALHLGGLVGAIPERAGDGPARHGAGYAPAVRRRLLLLAVAAALLALVVWRTRPWEAAALAARLDPLPLLLALALNAVVILLWAIRSAGLMAAVGSPLGAWTLVPVVAFANTINNLTPASAGEVLRAIVLRRRHAVPYESSTAVILAERLWAIGIIAVSATAAAIGTIVAASGELVAGAWLAA